MICWFQNALTERLEIKIHDFTAILAKDVVSGAIVFPYVIILEKIDKKFIKITKNVPNKPKNGPIEL